MKLFFNSWQAEYFLCFFCRLLTLFKTNFSKNSFKNTTSVANVLDSDQDQFAIGTDLGPNYLQKLSAEDKNHG